MRGMRNYFDLCFEEWTLNKREFLDEDTWKLWRGGMKAAMSKAAFREAWSIVSKDTGHTEDFKKFLSNFTNVPSP